MGYYIETIFPNDKAGQIVEAFNAAPIPPPTTFPRHPDCVLICVVQNGLFDAAGICYDEDEFLAFSDPSDPRPKTWLLMDRDAVIHQCPSVAGRL